MLRNKKTISKPIATMYRYSLLHDIIVIPQQNIGFKGLPLDYSIINVIIGLS